MEMAWHLEDPMNSQRGTLMQRYMCVDRHTDGVRMLCEYGNHQNDGGAGG